MFVQLEVMYILCLDKEARANKDLIIPSGSVGWPVERYCMQQLELKSFKNLHILMWLPSVGFGNLP